MNSSKIISTIKELLILIVTAFVLAYLFKTFIFQPFRVEMGSMTPNVMPDNRVLVNRFLYRFKSPKLGDVITLYSPEDANVDIPFNITHLFISPRRILIKRVIATEGQTIEIKSGQTYINDKKIKEHYVKLKDFQSFEAKKIPKNYVYVMGDNRANSKDSRYFGPIKADEVLGKAFMIYWPLNSIKTL